MCGIVGLYLKNSELRPRLGALFAPMLNEMSERGPDSAGFAVYREGTATSKLTFYEPGTRDGMTEADVGTRWETLGREVAAALEISVSVQVRATHVVLECTGPATAVRQWFRANEPDVRVMSSGAALEIYKEIGAPKDVMSRFHVADMSGSHMIGHTRMATESAVTTEGAHPFNTGDDLCLVHNGSLSNHNALKRQLNRDYGIEFQTENDSEVAAGYLTWRLTQGASLHEALTAALTDLDGFYTFTVGTRQGFAVLRDPVACKPAVLAETDDWVAMASEFRSLAQMPGVEHATVWEPSPATVYTWGHA